MHIDGNTELIAHIGFPTASFKAPMIYNPWFEKAGVNAVVVPMGCRPDDFPQFLRSVFSLSNIRGALITMPHKVTSVGLLADVLPGAAIVQRKAIGVHYIAKISVTINKHDFVAMLRKHSAQRTAK